MKSLIFIFHCLFWNEFCVCGKMLFNYWFFFKNIYFLNDNFNFKTFWSLNLVLSFSIKSGVKFENWFFVVSYLTIVLICHYLSNYETIEIEVLNFHLRSCLYKARAFPNRSSQLVLSERRFIQSLGIYWKESLHKLTVVNQQSF